MTTLEKLTPIDQRPSASERVAERLLSLISSGNIAPGDKLPSENELSKALQVSRPVVREALRGMAMMGIVASRQGGGCYVTDLKPQRLMAPLSFAPEAAQRATAAQVTTLRELVEAGFKLVDDPVGFRVMDAEFHALIATAADNDFLEKVCSSLYSLAIEQRRKASAKPGVLQRSARDHAEIVEAIAAKDPGAASAAMGRHVENIRKSTLQVMSEG
jgi:GntR family transcriptional repressor for pyruvate dehydrogenase complex